MAIWLSGSRGRRPLLVGHLLVLPLPVEATQLLVGRVVDAGFGGQLPQVALPVVAAVAAHNRLHGRIGFQQGRIHADGLARQQAFVLGQFQDEDKDLFVDAVGQTLADLGQAGVVGRRLVRRQAQEGLRGAAVGTTPGDGPLRGEALEVAEKEHAEVDAGRHARPAEALGVVGVLKQANLKSAKSIVILADKSLEPAAADAETILIMAKISKLCEEQPGGDSSQNGHDFLTIVAEVMQPQNVELAEFAGRIKHGCVEVVSSQHFAQDLLAQVA